MTVSKTNCGTLMENRSAKVDLHDNVKLFAAWELTPDHEDNIITMVRCTNPRICGVLRHEYRIPKEYYASPCHSCGADDHYMLGKVKPTEGMVFICPVSNLGEGKWDFADGRKMTSAKGSCFIVPELFAKYYHFNGSKLQEAFVNFMEKGMGQYMKESSLLWLEEQIRRVAGTSNYDEIPEVAERSAFLGQEVWALVEGKQAPCLPCRQCGSSNHREVMHTGTDGVKWLSCPFNRWSVDHKIHPGYFAECHNFDSEETSRALKEFRFWGEGRNLPKEEEFRFSQTAMETCFEHMRNLLLVDPYEGSGLKEEVREQL